MIVELSREEKRELIGKFLGRFRGVYYCPDCKSNVPGNDVSSGGYHIPEAEGCGGKVVQGLPDYFGCLNACFEMEKSLPTWDQDECRMRDIFADNLRAVIAVGHNLDYDDRDCLRDFDLIHADAEQRAEAFGRTMGIWT